MRRDYGALERARSPILASDLRSLGGLIGIIAVRNAPFSEKVQRFENRGGVGCITKQFFEPGRPLDRLPAAFLLPAR